MISDGGSDLICSRVNFGALLVVFSARACRCFFNDTNKKEHKKPHASAPIGADTITRSIMCLSE